MCMASSRPQPPSSLKNPVPQFHPMQAPFAILPDARTCSPEEDAAMLHWKASNIPRLLIHYFNWLNRFTAMMSRLLFCCATPTFEIGTSIADCTTSHFAIIKDSCIILVILVGYRLPSLFRKRSELGTGCTLSEQRALCHWKHIVFYRLICDMCGYGSQATGSLFKKLPREDSGGETGSRH